MRIKKTSQTTTLSAQTVNTYSDSTENAYACDYANKAFGGTILWANESPNSSFAGQDVSTNNDYDCIEVIYGYGTTGDKYSSGKIFKGTTTTLSIVYLSGGTYTRTRTVNYQSNGTCTFGDGYLTGNVNNAVAIPLYIIGYKTGLF